MTLREVMTSRLHKRTVGLIEKVLPFVIAKAEEFHSPLPDIYQCPFRRPYGRKILGKCFPTLPRIILMEPTANIVIIHETLHFLSSAVGRRYAIVGFSFWNIVKKTTLRWEVRGGNLFDEAVTERMALQIRDQYQAKSEELNRPKVKSARRRLRKSRRRHARKLLSELFEKIAQKLNMSIDEVERVYYKAYFSHDFREVLNLTDEAFGPGSFKALLSKKNDEANKLEMLIKSFS